MFCRQQCQTVQDDVMIFIFNIYYLYLYLMSRNVFVLCRQQCQTVQDRMCSTKYEPQCQQGSEKKCDTVTETVNEQVEEKKYSLEDIRLTLGFHLYRSARL